MLKSAAFTLFEVLMAMGIFALVVIGAMAALNAALTAAREARIEQHARIQIENRLALLEGGPIQEIERVVETETPKMIFTETVKRENVVGQNSTVLNGFWRVRVVAKWKADNEERSMEASFLRFGQ